MNEQRALIVAGGTGGHIIPGLTIATALQRRGWRVKWAGNPAAMEGKLVPAQGIELLALVFQGFRGKGLVAQLMMPIRLLKAFLQSVIILKQFKPSVVIGMGGYVAFPLCMMASLLNIPLVIHEQNSIAGLTNRVLSKLADLNLVAFPDALPKATWVGNPVRNQITDVATAESVEARYLGRTGVLSILVVGGSLGAKALNTLVPQALSLIDSSSRPLVTHQSGSTHIEALQENYHALGVQARSVAFIDDMADAMTRADLLICRAGAMTVAEVAAVGVAAMFVPFPHAVDDHQTHNATFLVQNEAAWLMQERDITPEKLSLWLKELSREQCSLVAKKAYALGKREATDQMVGLIEKVSRA